MHDAVGRVPAPQVAALLGLRRDKEPSTIARGLSGAGWRVTVVESAESLIAIANAELPELVVVDATFEPLVDGRHPAEALISLGTIGHKPRLVLVSNERDDNTIALATAVGASKVLVVPTGVAPRGPRPDTGPLPVGSAGPDLWVVDDSAAIRILARSAFERASWHVTEFPDLGSAHQALKTGRPPAAVLLDIHLPDGNGLDHVRTFTETGTIVVMLSNLAGPDQVERAFAAGAIDIVAKPFDLRSLVARAERALRWAPPAPRSQTQPHAPQTPERSSEYADVFVTQWL